MLFRSLDRTAIARRHREWFDELICVPGAVTSDGPSTAALTVQHVRNGAPVAVDSIGIGSSALDFCKGLGLKMFSVNASEGTTSLDKTGNFRFRNVRALMYWRLREALDPTATEPIALPPDQELFSDLAAMRFKIVTLGKTAAIQMLPKDDIRELLGRSPDKGDAVAMTFVDGLPEAGIVADVRAFRRMRGYA